MSMSPGLPASTGAAAETAPKRIVQVSEFLTTRIRFAELASIPGRGMERRSHDPSMVAPLDGYSLWQHVRSAVTSAPYPRRVGYTIAVSGLDGQMPVVDHYRGNCDPAEGLIRTFPISDEQVAKPPPRRPICSGWRTRRRRRKSNRNLFAEGHRDGFIVLDRAQSAVSFTSELKVPPEIAFASLVESFVGDAAQRSELPAGPRSAIVTAARRGFEAIVERALAESREPVRIVASCTALHLSVSLFERGLPMDDALARRDPWWDELCRSIDATHWRCHGMAGSELRLIVNRPLGATFTLARLPATGDDVPLAPEQEYAIRRFEPSDAAGVARAFYLTYGYAYDFNAVYDPARLIELNASGRYISIVAVTAAGDVVGHYALARDGDASIADASGAACCPRIAGATC